MVKKDNKTKTSQKAKETKSEIKSTKINKHENKVAKTDKDTKKVKKPIAEEIVEDPNVLTNEQEKEAFENIDINQVYENALQVVEKNLSLDKNQVSKAIKCIKDLVAKRHKDSFNILSNEDEELIYLNFVLGKLPLKYSLRPVSIPLPKSINGQSFNTRVCLFVKDSKADFKQLGIEFPFKVKVIDVQNLKMKYSRFQDRRNLLKQFDLFLCDYKIYFLLKKLLGKPFYVHRKYPVPIKLNYEDKEEIKTEVVSHVENSGVFYMTNGPNYAFKVARYSMDNADILENVLGSVKYVVAHIMKWGVELQDLKCISVKGANTIDLPVFNQLTKEEIESFNSK